MKKNFILSMIFILLVPCFVFSDMVTFRVGYFIPQAQSDLWQTEFENMDFSKIDFQNTSFGFSYEYFISRELSFALSIDGYTKKKVGIYNGYAAITADDGYDYAFENEEGALISHVFDVSITPIQVSLKLAPMGRRGKFIPYIGGGAGIYLWNVRLQGEMVDFSPGSEEEFTDGSIGFPILATDAREENKVKIGYHAFGGVMFPVANRISLEAEFKYNFLKGNMTDAFKGFKPFDLSGYQISIGLNYWF